MDPVALTAEEQQQRLAGIDGWMLNDNGLNRTFIFDSFVTAFGFMASAALVAERMNHHPEWSNVYNQVVVRLTTHDVGGPSQLDFDLAATMTKLAGG